MIAVELRHLEYFVAVAAELNFSRAAQRIHVVQSALSASVGKLEKELGVELFDRSKRQITLTAAGVPHPYAKTAHYHPAGRVPRGRPTRRIGSAVRQLHTHSLY